MNLWRRFKAWRRERQIMDACNCICFCPKCKDPLNDQATWLAWSDGSGTYSCRKCGYVSRWNFNIAPVPIHLPITAGAEHE